MIFYNYGMIIYTSQNALIMLIFNKKILIQKKKNNEYKRWLECK
jgi:hypothetical protein